MSSGSAPVCMDPPARSRTASITRTPIVTATATTVLVVRDVQAARNHIPTVRARFCIPIMTTSISGTIRCCGHLDTMRIDACNPVPAAGSRHMSGSAHSAATLRSTYY
jgi:hypothetical protein